MQKLRISVKAYESAILDTSCNKIVDAVKASGIEGAGKGVFAKKEFAAGEVIMPYMGCVIPATKEDGDTRTFTVDIDKPNQGTDGNSWSIADYTWTNKLLWQYGIYAPPTESWTFMQFVNDGRESHANNVDCKYDINTCIMWYVATKDIASGSELFISYGDGYWSV